MKLVPLNIMYNTFRERHILYNTRNNSSTKTRDGKTVHSGSEIISYLGHTVWHLIRENIKFWKPNEKKIDSCQKTGFIWNILSIYITYKSISNTSDMSVFPLTWRSRNLWPVCLSLFKANSKTVNSGQIANDYHLP